jgi:YVTN family beta-propeller protein
MTRALVTVPVVLVLFVASCARPKPVAVYVGPGAKGTIVPTQQLIRPAGKSIEFKGRPVDLALSPDGKTLYVKSNKQLLAIDAAGWTLRQELALPPNTGASMHGIAVSADGRHVYVTASGSNLPEAHVAANGMLAWDRPIKLSKQESYPCGVALLGLGRDRAVVCLSMANSVAVVDLESAKVTAEIPVGVAPYDVALAADGKTAFVSNWGGRRARTGDKTADSAGTETVVDDRGTASTGTVGVIDLVAAKQVAEIPVGLHPADVELSTDGKTLYVANANSDTINLIDTATRSVRDTIPVRPDDQLPFGSASNAVALTGEKVFVANGGNNAVGVVDLASKHVDGFLPAGWYPGGVVTDGKYLYIANVKGVGSRDPAAAGKWNSHSYRGSITKVAIPDATTLAGFTRQVNEDARVPQTLRAMEKSQQQAAKVPVPEKVGQPGVFEHVLYIIKENRTYDQLFGDLPRGNNDSALCIFGRETTPNHHALAEQFVQLDNFYCNGICSADGHAWATEGLVVDYLEKSFGAWSRSYPFPGDDALAIAPTGFIWDNALLRGLSFRNYGEMTITRPEPISTWAEIQQDYKTGAGKIRLHEKTAVDTLRRYSCPDSPGWNLRVSDQRRADVFLREFAAHEQKGEWPNLVTLYLPQDHTSGTNPAVPTPAAMVADNDLALGRVVEAVSRSKFWPTTCIFVIEDDPQSGFDHVDGHRSICLVISPYTQRGQLVSQFYNQTSVLHTLELMLGLPPMNQMDAMAPVMRECFTEQADLRPYACLPNNVPLDQMNLPKAALSGAALELAGKSERLPTEQPDLADEDTLNRIVWHSVKGSDAPYPAAFAGAHGRGLAKLHLKLDGNVKDDDDD